MCSYWLMIAFGTAAGALALSAVAFVLSVWAIFYTRMQAEAARSANAPEVAASLTLSYMHGTIALSEYGILAVTLTSKHHVRSCSVELLDGADRIGGPGEKATDKTTVRLGEVATGSPHLFPVHMLPNSKTARIRITTEGGAFGKSAVTRAIEAELTTFLH